MQLKHDRMYFTLEFIEIEHKLQEAIHDCLILVRLLGEPLTYQWNEEEEKPFDFETLQGSIQALKLGSGQVQRLYIQNNDNEFILSLYKDRSILQGKISREIFEANESMLGSFFDQKMTECGAYAYLRSYEEFLYHNIVKMEDRFCDTEEDIDLLPKMLGKDDEIEVDCNRLAGFDLPYKGLIFSSCYQMWFSPLFFQYIPREIFLEVQQVSKVTKLANQVVKICLYEAPFKWNHPNNLGFQMLFRDQVGMDQLTNVNGVGVLRPPLVEFTHQEQVIQSIQYQNEQLQPVAKNQAAHFVIRTTTIENGETSTRRFFGMLNSQAYFPWEDEENKRMMNYRTLDPSRMIDYGAETYEFFIRQFLEIHIDDPLYVKNVPVLKLYIPKKCFQHFPRKNLLHQLYLEGAVEVLNEAEQKIFDFRLEKSFLRVIFQSTEALDSVHEVEDLPKKNQSWLQNLFKKKP